MDQEEARTAIITEQELLELSTEHRKLLSSPYCMFCGTFSVYLDNSNIDYNDKDSWPVLRNTSDNEPHYCVNMEAVGVWR